MVSLDLYKKEIQGFFSIPVDNLRASPFLLQYIKENVCFHHQTFQFFASIHYGDVLSLHAYVCVYLIFAQVVSVR